jgi:hypothetical protein
MNRRLAFITSLLLLSCFIFFVTCKKEYSYEGGGSPPPPPGPVGNGTFTLAGSPNDCQNFIARGNYIANTRLVSSNTVDIHVNVIVAGNYTLTTDTLDGIWFSGSGTFTNTGDQTITLAGNGIAEFARNLIFTLLTGSSTCTFKVIVTNSEPLAIYVLESFFGNPNPCNHTIAGTYTSNTPLSISNTVSVRVYVTYRGNFTIATNTINGMMFSYSGIFTTNGFQDVILYGSGTPVSRGTFTLTPEIVGPHPLGGQACAVFITVN